MPIALEVLSGSRAGARPTYDKSVIAIGRHPASDLQFDPNEDLLVSARHAEIRDVGGRCTVRDLGSRNGTFVNGQRVSGETELHDGDELQLGADGPRVIVRRLASVPRTSASLPSAPGHATGSAAGAALDATMPPPVAASAASSVKPRPTSPSTDERVRVAVKRHTRALRYTLVGVLALLASGVGGAYWLGQRESAREVAELRALIARSDSGAAQLEMELSKLGDTALANALRQRFAGLRRRVEGGGSATELAETRQQILDALRAQQGLAGMNIQAISARNDAGVAFLASELAGKPYGSTAFGVTESGLLVTNRHNVVADDGSRATRVVVKFANTDQLLPAHVVTTSGDDSVDLALVQIDLPGRFPTVSGVAASSAALTVGTPVVAIGFPHSLDTPQDGEVVKTSLTGGIVGKRLPQLLQVDAYASHGSSGSPIFDARGLVVGVIYGGERESNGRIVYAVPSEKIVELLPAEARGRVR